MLRKLAVLLILQSPSVWREWIEMSEMTDGDLNMLSPSVWREWIEIDSPAPCCPRLLRLPPCGGSGLKCQKPL